jgi:ABC-2 type transport system ATP-binding protein
MPHGTPPLPSSPESAAEVPALRVEGVSHAFGARRALEDVGLTVPAGSFTALLGLNGAGKTTLFSLVTRLYGNRTGSIRVLGADVRRAPAAALARLGVVFQARTLDLDLTVRQNLLYHAALHGIGPGEARRRAEALLARIGLAARAREKVRKLSGGQMRRIEIARALLHAPSLLLLDEPTVGLDVEARQSLIAEVRRLVAEARLGVLWATHLIDEIRPGDRVVVLHRGRVLAEGSYDDILRRTGATDLEAAFRRLIGGPAGRDAREAAA